MKKSLTPTQKIKNAMAQIERRKKINESLLANLALELNAEMLTLDEFNTAVDEIDLMNFVLEEIYSELSGNN